MNSKFATILLDCGQKIYINKNFISSIKIDRLLFDKTKHTVVINMTNENESIFGCYLLLIGGGGKKYKSNYDTFEQADNFVKEHLLK